MESKLSDSSFEGDVVKHRAAVGQDGSPQDALAKFQLLKEKLAARAGTYGPEAQQVLGGLSEVETCAMSVLKHLQNFSESSPEAADVAAQCGTSDRFQQALWISERLVARARSEAFLQLYAPNQNLLKGEFLARSAVGLGARVEQLKTSKKALGQIADKNASPIAEIGRTALKRFGFLTETAGANGAAATWTVA